MFFRFLLGLYLLLMHSLALATFPDKPIRIVVPFSPGGGTDLIARTMGPIMAQELGQTVIIDNRPGAGTILGTDLVAKSPADGYTMVMATFAHAVNPSLHSKLPYAHERAFMPLILVGRSPNVLVVRADSLYKNLSDVMHMAKQQPGRLTYASQGDGTSAHLAGELFKSMAKVDLIHVPYKGAGPALTDLIGGQVDMMFATASAVGALIDAKKLRPLAVTSAQRSPRSDLLHLPTLSELGLSGYAADSWYGLLLPAGTPSAIVAKLNEAARKAALSDVFQRKVASEGLVVSAGTPEEFDRYLKEQELRWRKLIKDANISLH